MCRRNKLNPPQHTGNVEEVRRVQRELGLAVAEEDKR